MYVLPPSFGRLLILALTKTYLRLKGVSLRRARELFLDLHTLRLTGVSVKQDELVGTLVDVELLLRVCYDLVADRLRLLVHDYMEGPPPCCL